MPVCMGYFSVSFGFGAVAVTEGIRVWEAALISATTLAGAGQFAGVTLIAAAATLLETVLTLLVVNSRYSLMSLALGQHLASGTGFFGRCVIAFFNTDELFALAMRRRVPLTTSYMLGAGTVAFLGWVSGTLLGALAGTILPTSVRTALSVMLYGMFVAILIPQAKADKRAALTMGVAVVLSCCLKWIPTLKSVSAGMGIVICTVAAAGASALLFPVKEEEA